MLIMWLETEMKVWYLWFVISYFFSPSTVPESPCTTVHNWQHNTMACQESCRRLTLTPFLKLRSTTTFNKIPKLHFAKYRQTVNTMWKLTAKEVRFEWSHRPQAGFIYRDQAQDYIIYYYK